jgi:hypothetical protein
LTTAQEISLVQSFYFVFRWHLKLYVLFWFIPPFMFTNKTVQVSSEQRRFFFKNVRPVFKVMHFSKVVSFRRHNHRRLRNIDQQPNKTIFKMMKGLKWKLHLHGAVDLTVTIFLNPALKSLTCIAPFFWTRESRL